MVILNGNQYSLPSPRGCRCVRRIGPYTIWSAQANGGRIYYALFRGHVVFYGGKLSELEDRVKSKLNESSKRRSSYGKNLQERR